MRIAFVGHPYHKKTRSADFFLDLIAEAGIDVELFYDDFFYTNKSTCMEELLDGNHDAIFLWQTEYLAPPLLRARKRVLAIPMYDAARLHRPDFWKAISMVRVVSFCREMHNMLQQDNVDSNYFQYFPDPADFVDCSTVARESEGPRGFIWLRRPWDGISWTDARAVLDAIGARSAQLHLAIDDDSKTDFEKPKSAEIQRYALDVSSWFPEKSDLRHAIAQCDFYLSPRYFEGIGFSFLEAMAMGLCPVSSDTPTMNEYIFHGENGLLFDAGSESKLPRLMQGELQQLGRKARESVERGFERWTHDRTRLVDRLFSLSRPPARRRDYSSHLDQMIQREEFPRLIGRPRIAPPKSTTDEQHIPRYHCRTDRLAKPKLSVVTVVRDDVPGLRKTLSSLACQTYDNFECLVLDGMSSEDMLECVGQFANVIDEFVSQPDEGPYDAMVHGAEIARGEYVYFLNAGDLLYAKDTLERVMAAAQPEDDFLYGDHVWIRKDGSQLHHAAPDFEKTWDLLQKGYINGKWLSGIPAHQATFTRTKLLREHRYDLRFQIAADHEFMFRMRAKGARFRHCMETVALYFEGGMSSGRFARCQSEWYEIACMYGAGDGIHDFYAPALGYDLRIAAKVGSDNGSGAHHPPRNRMAEIAGQMAKGLPEESLSYKAARRVWRTIRPLSTRQQR